MLFAVEVSVKTLSFFPEGIPEMVQLEDSRLAWAVDERVGIESRLPDADFMTSLVHSSHRDAALEDVASLVLLLRVTLLLFRLSGVLVRLVLSRDLCMMHYRKKRDAADEED